jgi:SNF2 family DNA or RNA helicase
VKEDIDLGIPTKVEVVVPVDLSQLQKSQYKHILSLNFDFLARSNSTVKRNKPLCNIFAQLRKCVQHPYLFPEAEIRDPNMSREQEYTRLIEASGKLQVKSFCVVCLFFFFC